VNSDSKTEIAIIEDNTICFFVISVKQNTAKKAIINATTMVKTTNCDKWLQTSVCHNIARLIACVSAENTIKTPITRKNFGRINLSKKCVGCGSFLDKILINAITKTNIVHSDMHIFSPST
jgi:hypothetical protein